MRITKKILDNLLTRINKRLEKYVAGFTLYIPFNYVIGRKFEGESSFYVEYDGNSTRSNYDFLRGYIAGFDRAVSLTRPDGRELPVGYKTGIPKQGIAWQERIDREGRLVMELQQQGRLWTFPVADGNAYYYIVSFDPPIVQWIDIGDGWEAPDIAIRGLTTADLRAHVEARSRLGRPA